MRRSIGKTAFLALCAALPASSPPVQAQTVKGQSLAGNWVRIDSNNNPNDLMQVTIDPNGAVLTSVPVAARPNWSVGDLLWRAIQSNGDLEVRGSDGSYHPSTITFRSPDLIDLHIRHTGAGYEQTWQRAGPTIDGVWERISPAGAPGDGTQVQARGPEASIRFLPPSAPRSFRVGRRLWRNVASGGVLEVLGSDGQYHQARVTLVGTDSLRIDSSAPQVTSGQIWVRPAIVASARAGLAGPPANPNRPGSGLTPLNPPPALPPTPSAPPAGTACLATSLPHDAMGVDWSWGLASPTKDDPQAETLGIRDHVIDDFASSLKRYNFLTDIERSNVSGFQDGFAYVWQPNPAGAFSWEEARDLTATEYDQRSESERSAGRRPVDIEVYQTALVRTPGGVPSTVVRYAGVWASNPEGLHWTVVHDLTAAEYGQAFRNLRDNGYRLVDVEAYQTPNGLRYAGIWYQSCDNTNWRQRRDMDRDAYQQWVDDWRAQGFRVVDFESYRTPGGQRYAAIWERIPASRAWRVATDRDLTRFLNLHRRYVDEGLRLIDYESYHTGNGIRYGGVWAENERRYDFALKPLLDDLIDDPNTGYRAIHAIPGISVVVMQDDEVIYRRGFGWADSLAGKAAHSGTVYLTASVAKVIGATLAARLEESVAELDLSAPTSDYLEDLPSHHTHTPEQLLAKVGCAPHYPEGNEPSGSFYTRRLGALEEIWDDPLLSGCTPANPGLQYRYSTHGFTYVGAVLEEVLDEDISEIIAGHLTRPFGLTSMRTPPPGASANPFAGVALSPVSAFGPLGVRPHHLARGYSWTAANGSRPADYEETSWKVLGGGLMTDALDLARFGQLTREDVIADTLRLWTPITDGSTVNYLNPLNGVPTVGLAWVLGMDGTRRIAQHGGVSAFGFGGARSHLRIYRDDGLVIAILTNQRETQATMPLLGIQPGDAHPIGNLSTAIAAIVFANPPPP